MFWAACCLGCFGFLRTGEFTVNSPINPDIHLAVSEVQADSLVSPGSLGFILSAPRQTPFAKVAVATLVLGNVICALYKSLPSIFTSVAQLLAHSSFSLMASPPPSPLHRTWLTSSIKSILSAAGVPCCYTGHSFCIGTATSAASCGLPDHLIKTLRSINIHTPVNTIVGVAHRSSHLTAISCVSFSFPSCL